MHSVPYKYSAGLAFNHPRINNVGEVPKLESCVSFTSWKGKMVKHLQISCIELWLITEQGLHVQEPKNPTQREVVDMHQINATDRYMIEQGLGEKEAAHFEKYATAKEVWDALDGIYMGDESMRKNKFNALCNEAEGFYMHEGENHKEMYQRLTLVASNFYKHGVPMRMTSGSRGST